ncbi:aminotransferase class IV [Actinomycetes bacterium KLBMP 9797]
MITVQVDGRPATAEQLAALLLSNYGHFTALQVRAGRTRGLALHLDRLDGATRELFDTALDTERARDHLRHALAGTADAAVRVIVVRPGDRAEPSVLVVVRPPMSPPPTAQRLMSVPYLRPAAHLKHLGGFGQSYHGARARRRGFDDALLTGPDGLIAEAAIANVAFFDGTAVIWPDAPCLGGITMRLLEPRLPSRRAPVHLADVPSFAAAFVANSIGVAPVARVDDVDLPVDVDLMKTVADAYDAVPWDPI